MYDLRASASDDIYPFMIIDVLNNRNEATN